MKSLAQTITWIKPHYKHLALLSLLLLSMPIGTTQATSSPSCDIEKLKYFIKTVIEKIENPQTLNKLQKNEMIYFYGNAGSGKAKIISYLLRDELEKYYPEDEENLHTNKQPIDDTMNTNTQSEEDYTYGNDNTDSREEKKIFKIRRKDPNAIGPKIGQNAVRSEVTYSHPYFPQKNKHPLGYCSIAGFSDIRGIENILCSYISNNLIIQKTNKLKALCFVTSKNALDVDRGQGFLDSVISTISNLIEKTEECNPLDSIFIVVNNKSQIDNEELISQVFDMLNNFMEGFEKNILFRDVQKYDTYINILEKILEDSFSKETIRILAINPLDDGTSRKDFLKRISTSPIIPKHNLKRLASKQGEEKVKYLQEKIFQEVEPILDRILALKKTIDEKAKKASELANQIKELNKEKQTFEKTINHLKSQSQQIEKEQQKLNQKIIKAEKDKEAIQKQIEQLNLEKMTFYDNKEIEKLLSQYDDMIKNQKDKIPYLKNEQKEIKHEIKRLKHRIEDKNDEIDKRMFQIENETKQIEQLKNEKNILFQNITQDRIIVLAKEGKNWFDEYAKFLAPISDYWAKNKLEQKIFDGLRKPIYNAWKQCGGGHLLDKDKFKLQTDKHLKKIKEIINHYYDGKTKELTESPSQKTAKRLKDKITSLTKELDNQNKEKLTLQKQIDEGYSKINILETQKLEKIKEQIKKKNISNKTKQSLAEKIQEKEKLDTTIYNLQQSQNQKQENLHDISLKLLQARNKYEYLLKDINREEEIYQETSHELKGQEKELAEYEDMLQRKQPGIDLVRKIDSIVPMGLVLLSRFIKKYNQCTTNTKHTDNKF